jgi:hypothetical protein
MGGMGVARRDRGIGHAQHLHKVHLQGRIDNRVLRDRARLSPCTD